MEWIETEKQELDSAARDWVVRLVSGDVDEECLASFRKWRTQSAEHAAAFDRVRLDYARKAASPHISALLRPRGRMHRAIAVGAIAASIAIATFFVWPEFTNPPDYVAADGPAQGILLSDGSRILLDGGSAIDVKLSQGKREITLRRGRALFDVAHDRSRPFIVSARGGSATAVGTAYVVDETGADGAKVDVIRGLVRTERQGEERMVAAGRSVSWGRDGLVPLPRRRDRLAWCAGRIVVDRQSFVDAAALLDHYIPGKIIVLGSIRQARVGGVFSSTRAYQGLVALARSQGAEVRQFGGIVLVTSS